MNSFFCELTDKDKRIDVFLSEKLENMTRSSIQKLISDGNVKIGEKILKKNYKISGHEEIIVQIPEAVEIDILPENIPLDIVFEDDDIIIINKPKNMVVHPAPGHYSGTLVNALMYHCKDSLSGINGEKRPGIVHRIDKDTTGLMVVCKNDTAHVDLSAQIKAHTAKRIYEAIIFGNLKEDKGTINKPVGRHHIDRKKMCVTSENSKEAITHYEVIARYEGYTHVRFSLETGRTHQIRVHMQSIGHSIIGDKTYTNMRTRFALDTQCLHAKELHIKHPTTGEEMVFTAELPEYFARILKILNGNGA